MSLLLVVSKLAEEKTGGVQTRIINYSKNLPKFDIKPTILAISKTYPKISKEKYFGTTLYKFPRRKWFIFPWFLVKIIKRHKIDILHILEGACGLLHVLSLFIARLLRLRTGLSLYAGEMTDVALQNKIIPKIKLNLSQKLAQKIAVNSKATASIVPKRYKNKIAIVYPGVNLELLKYKVEKSKTNRINLLYVGRIFRKKGVDDLIKALALVLEQFPHVYLTIVGATAKSEIYKQHAKDLGIKEEVEPDSISVYKKLAEVLGIADKVKFTGEIRNLKKLAEFYSNCDIFLMTSKESKPPSGFESFGCVFLEAALFKKPVIGTRFYGIKEAVVDGSIGLLVEPDNPQDLARAIIKLIKNPDLRKKLGQAGYERTLAHFKDIDSTRQLAGVYKD